MQFKITWHIKTQYNMTLVKSKENLLAKLLILTLCW